MTIPVLTLVGFSLWTLLLLLGTVGIYRWSRILTGRVAIQDFRADIVTGEDWYLRAMRAHANCVENLPVFTVIVFALTHLGLQGQGIDLLCILVLGARVVQSIIHVGFVQTNTVTFLRFVFFFAQIVCFLWLIAGYILVTLQH